MTDGDRRDGRSDVEAHDVDAPYVEARDVDEDRPGTAADPASPGRTDVDAGDQVGGQVAGGQPAGGQIGGASPETADRQFDWRGWILVGAIFVSFLVIPGIIVLYPHVGPGFGLTFWDTYLALPLVPALVVALLAVWATTRP